MPIKQKHNKSKIVQVVDCLNPYVASANIRLVLDLVASRAGVGLALRCLSFLEIDVQNNWKPFKPMLQFIRQVKEGNTKTAFKNLAYKGS